jgi:hypothetical protein
MMLHSAARLLLVFCLGIFLCGHAQAASQCAPTTNAQQAVVHTIQQLMDALRTQNEADYRKILVPDFSAYDGGKQVETKSFWDLVTQAQASGIKFEWSVTEPHVQVDCNTAWIRYINQGSVEDASGKKSVTWLESGVLQYRQGQWAIVFLHSSRAAGR